MLKVFLFLYPITPFFEVVLKRPDTNIDVLNRIITARYRDQGYKIFWLFFSRSDNRNAPDENLRFCGIDIKNDDQLLVNFLDFNKFLKEREKLPFDNHAILRQLPRVTKLVLGGFHQWHCVDNLAKTAYLSHLNVFVDSDTTDLAFHSMSTLPIIRTNWDLETGFGLKGTYLNEAKKTQNERPWLVHGS